MNDEERRALKDLQGFASAGRIRYSRHFARDRAGAEPGKRGADFADVLRAIATATGCRAQSPEKYLVTGGRDLAGDALDVVCVLDRATGVFVVTVL